MTFRLAKKHCFRSIIYYYTFNFNVLLLLYWRRPCEVETFTYFIIIDFYI